MQEEVVANPRLALPLILRRSSLIAIPPNVFATFEHLIRRPQLLQDYRFALTKLRALVCGLSTTLAYEVVTATTYRQDKSDKSKGFDHSQGAA
jgi:hypothetical protein